MFARNAAKRSARQLVKKTFLTSCCFVLTEHKRPADGTEIRIRGRVLGGSVVQRGRLLSGSAIFSRLGGRRGILIRRRRNHGSEIARTRVVAETGDQLALACQCVGIHVFEVPLLHIAGFRQCVCKGGFGRAFGESSEREQRKNQTECSFYGSMI